MTIGEAQKKAKDILLSPASLCDKESVDLDTRVLLKECLKDISDIGIILNKNLQIAKSDEAKFFRLIQKRAEGISVAAITHKKEFFGNSFIVSQNTLIPRPESEIIVEEAAKYILSGNKDEYDVLDICTGSGCLGISMFLACKNNKKINLTLSDIDKKALLIAKKNNKKFACNAQIIQSDLFDNLKGKKFDIIIANPPYVKKSEYKATSAEVKNEPYIALVSKNDGLYHIQNILENAYKYLNEHFFLMIEMGYKQSAKVLEMAKTYYPNSSCKIIKDLAGLDRFIQIYS